MSVHHSDTIFSGTRLLTKDGRKIGNAVVVGVRDDEALGMIFYCQTDFGNRMKLTRREAEDLYYIGEATDLELRRAEQMDLLTKPAAGWRDAATDPPPVGREVLIAQRNPEDPDSWMVHVGVLLPNGHWKAGYLTRAVDTVQWGRGDASPVLWAEMPTPDEPASA